MITPTSLIQNQVLQIFCYQSITVRSVANLNLEFAQTLFSLLLNFLYILTGRVFTIPSPIALPELVVVSVSCGNEHCLLVTQCGSVFTWGSGR